MLTLEKVKECGANTSLLPQALAKFQTTHRVTTASGIETEESLLSESAARETSLNSQIIELELEAKQVWW